MDIDTYTNYDERKKKLFKDYEPGYIEKIEYELRQTDSEYHYTKIIGKPKTKEEYDANVKYLGKENKKEVIREIESNLQYKDRILRIEEYKKANHRSSGRMRQDDEGAMQAFPKGIQDPFFKWTTKEALRIYDDLVKKNKITKTEIDDLIAKGEEKLAAQQKAKNDENAEKAEEAAAEKIYQKQVERPDSDYNDDDEEEVKRRKRLILITHLDKRGDKDGIDSGYSEENGKEKKFWVDPDTEKHELYDFYDKDHYLGELEGYKKNKKEYAHSDINIQYIGYLRKTDQLHSHYENGDINITWYDEDEEYFNRQIKMKEAALKLSEGQRRNFWKVKWSDTHNQEYPDGRPYYTKYDHTDSEGDLIIYYNSEDVPDYDITKGGYFGVPKKKSAPAPAPAPAPASAPPTLPKGWSAHWSNKNSRYYFINLNYKDHNANGTQWELPTLPAPPPPAPAVPEGWTARWSNTHSRFYYINPSGETQWNPPSTSGGKKTRKKNKGKGKGKTKKAAKGKKNTRSKKAQRNKTKTKTKTKKGSKKM
jgi:hypothetical protein